MHTLHLQELRPLVARDTALRQLLVSLVPEYRGYPLYSTTCGFPWAASVADDVIEAINRAHSSGMPLWSPSGTPGPQPNTMLHAMGINILPLMVEMGVPQEERWQLSYGPAPIVATSLARSTVRLVGWEQPILLQVRTASAAVA